jgi:hypothetical protein
VTDDIRPKRRLIANNVIEFPVRAAAADGARRRAPLIAAWRCGDDGRLEIGWQPEPSGSSTASRHEAVS